MEQCGVSCLGWLIEVGVVSGNVGIGEGGLWLVWGLAFSTLEVAALVGKEVLQLVLSLSTLSLPTSPFTATWAWLP